MSRKNRSYTKEFKREALELLRTSGQSASQIERDLGITSGLLLKWRDRYQVKDTNGEPELAPSDLAAAQAEIRRLKRQLAIAEQERDILKKVPHEQAVHHRG
jgi:transposase